MLILNQTAPFLRTFTRFFSAGVPVFLYHLLNIYVVGAWVLLTIFFLVLDFCLENESESKN